MVCEVSYWTQSSGQLKRHTQDCHHLRKGRDKTILKKYRSETLNIFILASISSLLFNLVPTLTLLFSFYKKPISATRKCSKPRFCLHLRNPLTTLKVGNVPCCADHPVHTSESISGSVLSYIISCFHIWPQGDVWI